MLTDFEFFIATLPDWDGKDRVTELERLVKMQLVVYAGGGVGTSPVKRLIIEVIRKKYKYNVLRQTRHWKKHFCKMAISVRARRNDTNMERGRNSIATEQFSHFGDDRRKTPYI